MATPVTLSLSGRRCSLSTADAAGQHFLCPLGEQPAKGRVLLTRANLDALDLDALHTLTWGDEQGRTVTLRNLVLAREPECLSPDSPGDADALYSCEIADSRWRCHNPHFNYSANHHFNLRLPVGGASTYYPASLNAGAAWTWTQVAMALWELMPPLGAYPGLPLTPDGTPEGWQFVGSSAWLALCKVLLRIGCMVRPDLTLASNQFSIVQVGSADAAADAALAAAEAAWRLLDDGQFRPEVRGIVPYGVRVFFFRRDAATGTTPWPPNTAYTVDVVGPDAVTAEPGVYTPIIDDEPAIYDATGSLTNGHDLDIRAAERAADYYRMQRDGGGSRLHKTYSGVLALMPGATIKAVAFRLTPHLSATGDPGVITEVVRHPYAALPNPLRCCDAAPALPQPLPTPSGSGTGGGPLVVQVTTANTSTTTPVITSTVTSTGTPAAGFGGSYPVYLTDTGGTPRPVLNTFVEFNTAAGPTTYTATVINQVTDHGGSYVVQTVTTDGSKATVTYTPAVVFTGPVTANSGTLTGNFTGDPNFSGTPTVGGTLTVTSGGTLTAASGSAVNLAGGATLASGGSLTAASGSTVTLSSGSTLALNGPTASVGANTTLTVANGVTLTLAGTGTGAVAFSAPVSFSGGLTFSSGTNHLKSLLVVSTTANGGPGQIVYDTDGSGDPTTLLLPPNTNAATPASTPSKAGLLAVFDVSGTPVLYFAQGASSSADWKVVTLGAGGGTVTTVSVVTANGVSGSVANATTTPALTLTLGAITPTSVNGVVISGSSTPTLAVTGTTAVSGTNTGDQTSVSGSSGSCTGNAATATALQTGRAINGVTFDGTAAITVTAAAGTLTGTTLNSTVVTSSLTSVGTLTGLTEVVSDAATNATSTGATFGHNSSGTAADGYGSVYKYQLQDSTTPGTDAANLTVTWATAAHATRKARAVWNVFDTATREVLRMEASGSAALIGFLGATAVARQTGDVGTGLVNLGLFSGTPTFAAANLTGTTVVANGGTGAATLTAHGVLMGEGTGAVAASGAGTSGQVFTSGGASADGAYADPITATNGESVLAANFTLASAAGTYDDTGLSVTLPSAGTYLVLAKVRGQMTTSTGTSWFLGYKLFNSTDAADVANSEALIVYTDQTGAHTYLGTITTAHRIVVTASKVIKLYCKRDGTGTPVFTGSLIPTNTEGRTALSYYKVGN